MAAPRSLDVPLVNSNNGVRAWWRRPAVKVTVTIAAIVAIGTASVFLMQAFQATGQVSMQEKAKLMDRGPKSVPELLKLYPKPMTVKHANEFFRRLPVHDMEDAVFKHIQPSAKILYHNFLMHSGSTAPHFKTGEKMKKRHKLEEESEFIYRLGVFEGILRDIISLNNYEARYNPLPDRAVFGITKFSDWTWDEFQTLLKAPAQKLNTSMPPPKEYSQSKARAKAPCTKNWAAEYPTVFKPRNQGSCGSCYAHAAAETMRAQAFINSGAENDPGELSVQFIIDCKGNGCNGGDAGNVMNWVAGLDGIPSKGAYGPYTESSSTCKSGIPNVVTTTGAERFRDEEGTANKLCSEGPLSMGVAVNNAFQSYHSGVLTRHACPANPPNHDTQVVAVLEEQNAFMIRNSWGDDWGISPVSLQPESGGSGFILLRYGYNTCDLTDCNSFAKDAACIGDCSSGALPPAPAPAPVSGGGCANTCQYADDGACDDGGFGASYSVCELGSDCDDCGSRGGQLCTNTCKYPSDGGCDDGGPGASYSICAYGSDCDDCGPREPEASCSDDCRWANDGECDEPTYCSPGTDCTDCQR